MAGLAFGNTLQGKINKDPFYRTALLCPLGTPAIRGDGADVGSLLCKAGGLAWFVAPKSSEILCTRPQGGEQAALDCVVKVTGITDWFVPNTDFLNNPGYVCKQNWNTCIKGVGITTNYVTCCYYGSTTIVAISKGPTNYQIQELGAGVISCYDVNDATNNVLYRTIRCITY